MGTQSTNFSADTFLLFLNPDILIMRDATCKILEMVDEGLLDPKMVAMACLGYMSEDDVKGMARANDINLEDEEDEDDEDDEQVDNYNYDSYDGQPTQNMKRFGEND